MYEYRKSELLKYLQFYLSKKLRMEVVIRNIINRLKQNKRLSINQFNSIIKFIERENNFISMSREQIFDYFEIGQEEEDFSVSISGRVMAKRVLGKISFFTITPSINAK